MSINNTILNLKNSIQKSQSFKAVIPLPLSHWNTCQEIANEGKEEEEECEKWAANFIAGTLFSASTQDPMEGNKQYLLSMVTLMMTIQVVIIVMIQVNYQNHHQGSGLYL